jgi:hypothetical protein
VASKPFSKRPDILSESKPATREKAPKNPAGVPERLGGDRGQRIYGPGDPRNKTRKPFGR